MFSTDICTLTSSWPLPCQRENILPIFLLLREDRLFNTLIPLPLYLSYQRLFQGNFFHEGYCFSDMKRLFDPPNFGFFHSLAVCLIKYALFDLFNQIYVHILTSISLELFLSLGNNGYHSITTSFSLILNDLIVNNTGKLNFLSS